MSGENFSGNHGAEATYDPAVAEVLEFLKLYGEIQKQLAWLIEASANVDGVTKSIKRAHLHGLMQQLGLDPEDPSAFTQLERLRMDLTSRTRKPEPRIDVPDVGYFEERIDALVSEHRQFGPLTTYRHPVDGEVSLQDVATYGHTDWQNVRSRNNDREHVGVWIHGVATIMADPITYAAQFAGLGIDEEHRHADHIAIAGDWSIQNGRHRSLAARSLGEAFIAEAGMSQWVHVAIEQ